MAKYIVNGEQYFGIDGQMLEIKRQLRSKSGSPLKPGDVIIALQNIIEGRFNRTNDVALRLIPGGEKLMIEALDGRAYISDAKDIFTAGINGDFRNLRFNQSGLATDETFFEVREIMSNGTSTEIFSSITSYLDRLVMTQHQIIYFCKKYPAWFHQPGCDTFFLISANGKYFLVRVQVHLEGQMCINLFDFDVSFVWRDNNCRLYQNAFEPDANFAWNCGNHPRVVTPQIIPV